jgi:plastocyanin
MSPRLMRLAIVAASLTLVATACAKSSNTGAPSSGTPSATPSSSGPVALSGQVNNKGAKDLTSSGSSIKLSLEADNYYFKPTFIKAAPGATVNLEVENESSAEHNFSITGMNIDKDVEAGKKAELTFTLPSSGAVNFFCKYHVGSGMQGAFYFTGGLPVTQQSTSSGGTGGY